MQTNKPLISFSANEEDQTLWNEFIQNGEETKGILKWRVWKIGITSNILFPPLMFLYFPLIFWFRSPSPVVCWYLVAHWMLSLPKAKRRLCTHVSPLFSPCISKFDRIDWLIFHAPGNGFIVMILFGNRKKKHSQGLCKLSQLLGIIFWSCANLMILLIQRSALCSSSRFVSNWQFCSVIEG